MPTRSGWPRCSRTCSTTPPSTPRRPVTSGSPANAETAKRSCPCATPASASPPNTCRTFSGCSGGRPRRVAQLLDLGLPKMTGYEAARIMRNESWGGTITLVALTGWGQEEDKRRSVEAGFDHHLTKPVEAAALEKLLALLAPQHSS